MCHARSLLLTNQQFDIHTHTAWVFEKRGWAWDLPSPARPKRKNHATEGTRLLDHDLHHSLRCTMSSILYPFAPHHAHTQFGCHAIPPPELPSLRCHLAALTLVLHSRGYRVFHNQSQKIGIINNWPSNTQGSVKHLQPTTVWSQTHSLRHQFGKDTIWCDIWQSDLELKGNLPLP